MKKKLFLSFFIILSCDPNFYGLLEVKFNDKYHFENQNYRIHLSLDKQYLQLYVFENGKSNSMKLDQVKIDSLVLNSDVHRNIKQNDKVLTIYSFENRIDNFYNKGGKVQLYLDVKSEKIKITGHFTNDL